MFEKKNDIFNIKRYISKIFTKLQKICSGFARIEIVDSYKNLHAQLGDTIKITLDRTYTTYWEEGLLSLIINYNERPRRRLWLSFHKRSIQMSSTSEASHWRIRIRRVA